MFILFVITDRNEGGRPNHQLYSYIDVDHVPLHVEESFQPLLSGGTEVLTFAAKHSDQSLRKRKPVPVTLHQR